jgi:2-phosphosulfolactate phosphatase
MRLFLGLVEKSRMPRDRDVLVHLLPELAAPGSMVGGVAVVIDVLRAATTMVHALAAGCVCIRPCAEVDEARALAGQGRAGKVLLAGERGGQPIAGFDLGNSPRDFTAKKCKGATLVFTTTNGTRALIRSAEAERVFVAGFVNFSAVCEQLQHDARPVHIVCAGTEGSVALEDTLLAGALVDALCDQEEVRLNDSARLAWDCFENHGRVLAGALEISRGGAILRGLGYDDDIAAAAQIDAFALVPQLRRDPLRVELGAVGIVKSRWRS